MDLSYFKWAQAKPQWPAWTPDHQVRSPASIECDSGIRCRRGRLVKKPQVEGDFDAKPRTRRRGNLHAGQLAPRITVGASAAMAKMQDEGVDWRASISTQFGRLRL
jgi:hypothetical protein